MLKFAREVRVARPRVTGSGESLAISDARRTFVVIVISLLLQAAAAPPCLAQDQGGGDRGAAPLPSRAIADATIVVFGSTSAESHVAMSLLDRQAIELLPATGRNFTDIVTTAPGVQQGKTGLSIYGSTGPENRYLVNGVPTNDIVTGVSVQPIRLDFVEEIRVKSSSSSAEHGAAMGGTLSVVTRSGGDRFRGFAGAYFLDPRFRGNGAYRPETRISPVDNVTPEVFVGRTEANTRSPDYEWLGDLGGPIKRQRLWFYASAAATYQPSTRTVLFSAAPQAGPARFTSHEESRRIGAALTAAVTPKLRARVTSQMDRAESRGSLPGQMQPDGYTSLANPATRFDLAGEHVPSRLFSANVDYAPGRKWLVSSRFGWMSADQYDRDGSYLPEVRHTFRRSNVGLTGVPAELQFPQFYTSTALTNVGRARGKRTLAAWDLDGTWFTAWHGKHAIKAGFNGEWVEDDVLNGNTAPNIFLYWDASFVTPDNRTLRGPFGYYGVQQTGTFGKVSGDNLGLFVQDTWQPHDRITVNAGIRGDREVIPSYNASPGFRFGFPEKLAPRIGVAWDITRDGRSKAYGSYGRFFDRMKLRSARLYLGGEVLRWDYYSLDTADWRTVTCRGVSGAPPDAGCPGEHFGYEARAALNESGDIRIDPDLRASSTTEYVAGFDHQLASGLVVGARYVRRTLQRLVEDVGISRVTPTSSEIVYDICNPGFGICENTATALLPDGRPYPAQPGARRDYDALEVQATRRLGDRFYVNGSYAWSHLRGNVSGLGSEDGVQIVAPNVTSAFDTIYMAYDAQGREVRGRLPHDRPHVFKAQGGYVFAWGTSIGANYVAQSGALESTTIFQRGRDAFINGRGDLGRVDPLSQVDLRVQHEIRVFSNHRLNLTMDVWNVFDQRAVVDLGNTPYRDSFTIPDAVYFAASGFDIASYVAGIRATANDPLGRTTLRANPFYGKPEGTAAYQSRRMFQFSAKYRF